MQIFWGFFSKKVRFGVFFAIFRVFMSRLRCISVEFFVSCRPNDSSKAVSLLLSVHRVAGRCRDGTPVPSASGAAINITQGRGGRHGNAVPTTARMITRHAASVQSHATRPYIHRQKKDAPQTGASFLIGMIGSINEQQR